MEARRVWRRDERDGWVGRDIPPHGIHLARGDVGLVVEPGTHDDPIARIVPVVDADRIRCVLLPRAHFPNVLVNGFPALPTVLLEGRTELVVEGELLYVAPGSGASPGVVSEQESGQRCARCKAQLACGDEVLRCSCNALHHQGERADGREPLECGTYTSSCASCGAPMNEAAWTPEDPRD
jgi:hypothetical protein